MKIGSSALLVQVVGYKTYDVCNVLWSTSKFHLPPLIRKLSCRILKLWFLSAWSASPDSFGYTRLRIIGQLVRSVVACLAPGIAATAAACKIYPGKASRFSSACSCIDIAVGILFAPGKCFVSVCRVSPVAMHGRRTVHRRSYASSATLVGEGQDSAFCFV